MRKLLTLAICALPLAAQAQINLNDGLVARYLMDGNAQDASGNANHGSIQGGVNATADRNGVVGGAMSFGGLSGYISVPHSASLASPTSAITLATWVRVSQWNNMFGEWAAILSKSNVTAVAPPQYNLLLSRSGTATAISATPFQPGAASIALNQWLHVAVTFDGATVLYYLNGTQVASQPSSARFTPNTLPLEIGHDTPSPTKFLYGALDEVNIYNRALSGAEVRALMNFVTSARAARAAQALQVYPSPAPDGSCTVLPPAELRGPATLELSDALGRVVYTQAATLTPGIPLAVRPAGLAAGMYRLRLRTATQHGVAQVVVP